MDAISALDHMIDAEIGGLNDAQLDAMVDVRGLGMQTFDQQVSTYINDGLTKLA